MKGPRPGIARAPIPASHPRPPPNSAPVPAPVVAPSGALVFFSCAKSLVPSIFGKQGRHVVVGKSRCLQSFDGTIHTRPVRVNAKYCCILPRHCDLLFYCLGLTSSWLVTFSLPTISAALASIALFSSSDRTGPLSVTMPFCEMIFTLWA